MSTFAKCKAVVANPFSNATSQPKIPDGAVPASMGAKRHLTHVINFNTENTIDIIISPRYDSPLWYSSSTRKAGGDPIVGGAGDFEDNHPFAKCWASDGAADKIVQLPTAEISKIRMVSQGCKLTLVNSTDDNDGWFEAFRFQPNWEQTRTYATLDASATAGTAYTPKATVTNSMFGNRPVPTATTEFNMNLASKANYVTGKLRNLHRYTWLNKPSTKDVEFKNLGTDLRTGTAPGSTRDNYTGTQFIDPDYDVIWIRCHGRGIPQDAQGGCCLPTSIMAHICQNIECVFGEQNTLHSYMTKSPLQTGWKRTGSLPYMSLRKPYKGKAKKKMGKTKKKTPRLQTVWI
nr:capsid protein [Cressdnaviricota sp.]